MTKLRPTGGSITVLESSNTFQHERYLHVTMYNVTLCYPLSDSFTYSRLVQKRERKAAVRKGKAWK
jgi:hypothetical protein